MNESQRYVITLLGSGTWNNHYGASAADAVAGFVRERLDVRGGPEQIWYGISAPTGVDGITELTFLAAPSAAGTSVGIQSVEVVKVRVTPPEQPGYKVEVV